MVCPYFTPPESSTSKTQSVDSQDGISERPSDHDSLRLIGTTKFPPLKNVKTIFITGGAGFMSVYIVERYPK